MLVQICETDLAMSFPGLLTRLMHPSPDKHATAIILDHAGNGHSG